MSKELTGVVEAISGNRRFLVMFQGGWEKDLASNKLTVVIVDSRPVNKEAKVPTISKKLEESVDLEEGYYHGVYVFLLFKK